MVAERIVGELFDEDRTAVEKLKAETIKNFSYLTAEEKKKRADEHAIEFESARMTTGQIIRAVECPCCKNKGYLVGDVTGKKPPVLNEYEIVSKLIVTPRLFACRVCRFKIEGYGKLRIGSLADQFEYPEVVDPVDYFGIDPMDYVTDQQLRDYFGDDEYY